MHDGRHCPARQAFTAQLGEPDKEADAKLRVKSAPRSLPGCHGNRGGFITTRMKTAPRICGLLSAFQRAGCEGKGGDEDMELPPTSCFVLSLWAVTSVELLLFPWGGRGKKKDTQTLTQP